MLRMTSLLIFAFGFLSGWLGRAARAQHEAAELRRLTRSLHESETQLRASQEAQEEKGDAR
jgi:hypothetical protein